MFEVRSIVCATDGTIDDLGAICHALRIALAGQATIAFVRASDGEATKWQDFPGVRERLTMWGKLPEGATGEDVAALGLHAAKLQVWGTAERGLANLIEGRRPDLLVLGTHQRTGLGRWLLPSVAEALARATRVSTLFVPAAAPGFVDLDSGAVDMPRALVPIDHEPEPSLAVQLLQRLRSTLRTPELTARLLHVGEPEDAPAVDRMPDDTCWETEFVTGNVRSAITQAAQAFAPSVIAMSTQGHESLGDRLFGSTVERVLRHAECPVLVAPPTM